MKQSEGDIEFFSSLILDYEKLQNVISKEITHRNIKEHKGPIQKLLYESKYGPLKDIFKYLTIFDLLENLSLVCKKFHQCVISNLEFTYFHKHDSNDLYESCYNIIFNMTSSYQCKHSFISKIISTCRYFNPSHNDNQPIVYCLKRGFVNLAYNMLTNKHFKDQQICGTILESICDYHVGKKNINVMSNNGKILRRCVKHGYNKIFNYIWNKEVNIDYSFNDNILLSKAAFYGRYSILKKLLQNQKVLGRLHKNHVDYDVSDDINMSKLHDIEVAFLEVIENNHYECVKLFMDMFKRELNPSFDENEALIRASINGCFRIVKLLLSDERVNPSSRNSNTLYQSCIHGHYKIVRYLLTYHRNRIDHSVISIHELIQKGRLQCIKECLKDERILNSCNPKKMLQSAIYNHNGDYSGTKIITFLMNKYHISIGNEELLYCKEKGKWNVYKLLTFYKRKMKIKNKMKMDYNWVIESNFNFREEKYKSEVKKIEKFFSSVVND